MSAFFTNETFVYFDENPATIWPIVDSVAHIYLEELSASNFDKDTKQVNLEQICYIMLDKYLNIIEPGEEEVTAIQYYLHELITNKIKGDLKIMASSLNHIKEKINEKKWTRYAKSITEMITTVKNDPIQKIIGYSMQKRLGRF